MISKYSVVFIPPSNIVSEIKNMKLKLADQIGWFNSKNSAAHITICEFQASEKELTKVVHDLELTCKYLQSKEVALDHFDSYESSGAFFIAPNAPSNAYFSELMKAINQNIKIKGKYSSSSPHLSIARKLDPEKTMVAHQLFREVLLVFNCESVYLRRFDPNKKQYEVLSAFQFKNEIKPESGQQLLF